MMEADFYFCCLLNYISAMSSRWKGENESERLGIMKFSFTIEKNPADSTA